MSDRGIVCLVIAVAAVATQALAQRTRQVDDQLLRSGSRTGEEWVSYGVNWSEQRFSPLDQINAANVSRLGLAWAFAIPGESGKQEATPLVFNGVLYSIAPWSVVYAVDLRTGRELWRQDPQVNHLIWQSRICCGVVNRGIALYQGKVIAPVIDGRLRALDVATGKVLWETRVSPEEMPYTITMAPRVIKGGRVIVGVSGGEYGVRGFFSAYDVQTGKMEWRFYTVPGDPSKPFEHPDLAAASKTWNGDWYKTGGGAAAWNGIAYDPAADIVYAGTGQPGPWSDKSRGSADALYSDCILAVRGATGKLVWYYQEVPGDQWDYDSVADITLADLAIGGKIRRVLLHAPKDGLFYVLDRLTGQLISADPITKVSWMLGIDSKTGRPNVNPAARYQSAPVTVWPGTSGGHAWQPWSFDPLTGLVYIPAKAGEGSRYAAYPDFSPRSTNIGPNGLGEQQKGASHYAVPAPPTLSVIGPDGPSGNVLYAWDPVARKERWRAPGAGGSGFFASGCLATKGNLVFSSVDGHLLALRADTGEKLLELPTGLIQIGPPMTFLIDRVQYVAVAGSGSGGSQLLLLALDGKVSSPILETGLTIGK
jgi:quinohemoprotein ethanol dehydrogenase